MVKTYNKQFKQDALQYREDNPHLNIKDVCRNLRISTQLKNILKRDFSPNEPNAVWCRDITYIWIKSGFVYLTSIMDLYSRKIIAWEITDN